MRVAVLGSGQLARMLALEGIPLGIEFSFLAEEKGVTDTRCVDGLGHIAYWEENMTGEQLFEALKKPDVVTFEKEQIEIDFWKNAAEEKPDVFSIPNLINKFKDADLFLDKISQYAPVIKQKKEVLELLFMLEVQLC